MPTLAAIPTSSSRIVFTPPIHRNPSLYRNPSLHLRPRRPLSISAVAVPPFILSLPSTSTSVLNLARPLLASVRSLPARITAVAARATPTPEFLAAIKALFSAAFANQPPGGIFKTPIPAFLSGAASMISLYAELLHIRVILGWFPNVPWERQPFSALRDLCDPYLSLWRIILPPFKGFDSSPLLAFWVLGFLSSFLNNQPPQMY